MARGSNLYRRGAVYWWRRRLSFAVLEKSTITLSLSLLTRELSIARARGAAMTMASERLRMTIQQRISAGSVTPAVANAIFQQEMKAVLIAIIEVDAGLMVMPYNSGLPIGDRGRICIQQYWSGALQGGLRDAPGWTYADENWPKLTTEEKQHLMFAARQTPVRQELAQRAIALLLDAGVAVTPRNEAVAARVIIEARAKVAANALDPQWLGSGPIDLRGAI